jgi:hypothetical protein
MCLRIPLGIHFWHGRLRFVKKRQHCCTLMCRHLLYSHLTPSPLVFLLRLRLHTKLQGKSTLLSVGCCRTDGPYSGYLHHCGWVALVLLGKGPKWPYVSETRHK